MESTLTIPKKELEAQVGLFLGYGRGEQYNEKAWNDKQLGIIDQCVRSGLRQFYYPPPVGGRKYTWAFLSPVATLTLPSAGTTVELPDDFGSLVGDVVNVTTGSRRTGLKVPISALVRQYSQASPDQVGEPQYAILEPVRGTTAKQSSRWQIRLWPIADQEFTLRFRYNIAPDSLTGDRPYAYGGAPHAETLIESCLAIAEERFDNEHDVHRTKWQERLAASVAYDSDNQPQTFGYNGDRSDGMCINPTDPRIGMTATFGGVAYD